MATIIRKAVNPSARYNISLKRTERVTVEAYIHFLKDAHQTKYTSGDIIEQMIKSFAANDKDFIKYNDALPTAVKEAIDKEMLRQEKKGDKKDTPKV